MSKFEMLTSLARRSVNKVERAVVGPGTVAPKAGYKDSWLVGGLHPHIANRRNFSIRTGVKVAAAAGVSSAAMIAMSAAAEARSRKSKAQGRKPASEHRLTQLNGGPTTGSPDAQAAQPAFKSSGDPTLDGYQRTVDSLTRAVNEEAARGGFGEKSAKASKALAEAQRQLADYKKQKAADDRAAAEQATKDADAAAKRKQAAEDDAYAKSPTGMAVAVAKEYGGYAVGAIAGIAMAKTLTKRLAKGAAERVARFEHVAGEVEKLNEATTGKTIIGSSKGDKMASLLKEAFRTSGVDGKKLPGIDPLSMKAAQATVAGTKAAANRSKSIAVGDLLHKDTIIAKTAEVLKAEKPAGMTVKAIDAEARNAAVAVEHDRHFSEQIAEHADATDARMFKEGHRLDNVIAAGLLTEGIASRAYAYVTPDENQKTLFTNLGNTSIGAAAMFHTSRAIAHANPTIKPSAKAMVAITSARDRIAREVMRAGHKTGHLVEAEIERQKVLPKVSKARQVAAEADKVKVTKAAAAKVADAEKAAIRRQADALFAKSAPKPAAKVTLDVKAPAQPTGHVEAPVGTHPKGRFSSLFR